MYYISIQSKNYLEELLININQKEWQNYLNLLPHRAVRVVASPTQQGGGRKKLQVGSNFYHFFFLISIIISQIYILCCHVK